MTLSDFLLPQSHLQERMAILISKLPHIRNHNQTHKITRAPKLTKTSEQTITSNTFQRQTDKHTLIPKCKFTSKHKPKHMCLITYTLPNTHSSITTTHQNQHSQCQSFSPFLGYSQFFNSTQSLVLKHSPPQPAASNLAVVVNYKLEAKHRQALLCSWITCFSSVAGQRVKLEGCSNQTRDPSATGPSIIIEILTVSPLHRHLQDLRSENETNNLQSAKVVHLDHCPKFEPRLLPFICNFP